MQMKKQATGALTDPNPPECLRVHPKYRLVFRCRTLLLARTCIINRFILKSARGEQTRPRGAEEISGRFQAMKSELGGSL